MAISKKVRLIVSERANYCCEYCQCIAKFIPVPFVMEHIIPQVKGGSDKINNLAFSCHHCNGTKYNKTEAIDSITQKKIDLFHPRNDSWTEHFKWNDDFMKIIGITPKGRATIETLKLNRENVINHRMVLFLYGVHPPKHTFLE